MCIQSSFSLQSGQFLHTVTRRPKPHLQSETSVAGKIELSTKTLRAGLFDRATCGLSLTGVAIDGGLVSKNHVQLKLGYSLEWRWNLTLFYNMRMMYHMHDSGSTYVDC